MRQEVTRAHRGWALDRSLLLSDCCQTKRIVAPKRWILLGILKTPNCYTQPYEINIQELSKYKDMSQCDLPELGHQVPEGGDH